MLAPTVGFIAIDRNCAALIAREPDEFDKVLNVDSADVRDPLKAVIKMMPQAMLDAGEWGNFIAYDDETRRVVGSCGYKTPPAPNGSIEIAYVTFPPYEGQGFATAMVGALVSYALDSIDVSEVIAHTLPEANASTKILEKCAFQRAGEANDPEDGPVWRWRYGP
jgi:RimJ/RimL family protein N-acetyltransferase